MIRIVKCIIAVIKREFRINRTHKMYKFLIKEQKILIDYRQDINRDDSNEDFMVMNYLICLEMISSYYVYGLLNNLLFIANIHPFIIDYINRDYIQTIIHDQIAIDKELGYDHTFEHLVKLHNENKKGG